MFENLGLKKCSEEEKPTNHTDDDAHLEKISDSRLKEALETANTLLERTKKLDHEKLLGASGNAEMLKWLANVHSRIREEYDSLSRKIDGSGTVSRPEVDDKQLHQS